MVPILVAPSSLEFLILVEILQIPVILDWNQLRQNIYQVETVCLLVHFFQNSFQFC